MSVYALLTNYSVNGKFKTRYSKATNYLAFLHTLILCVVISKYRLVEDEYIVAIVYNCNEEVNDLHQAIITARDCGHRQLNNFFFFLRNAKTSHWTLRLHLDVGRLHRHRLF